MIYKPAGGENAPDTQLKERDKTLTLSTTIPTRTGYTFLGWKDENSIWNHYPNEVAIQLINGDIYLEDIAPDYLPGEEYTANSSITLFALWKPNATSGKIEVVVNNSTGSSTPATITAPVSGWIEGENTFTVSCDKACVLLVTNDGGQTYTRLKATASGNAYSFTATLTKNSSIVCTIKGDLNGDGKLAPAEARQILLAGNGLYELTSLKKIIGDLNGDGKLAPAEARQALLAGNGLYTISW